jgi:hypothetical protein
MSAFWRAATGPPKGESMFEIDSTPFPAKHLMSSKYDATFSDMRPGQCIKTELENVQKVAGAMKKWLEKKGRADMVVRLIRKMDDGFGRVYMMPAKPMKMADLPSRKVAKLDMQAA